MYGNKPFKEIEKNACVQAQQGLNNISSQLRSICTLQNIVLPEKHIHWKTTWFSDYKMSGKQAQYYYLLQSKQSFCCILATIWNLYYRGHACI